MASFVAKVQFQNSLRRLSLGSDATTLSFAQLVARTRDLFQIPTNAKLSLTYVDRDGDVVTMVDDQDLQDALVMQSLNPLRLAVAVVGDEGVQAQAPAADVAVKKESAVSSPEVPTESLGDATAPQTEPSAADEKSSVDGAAVTGSEQQQEGFPKEDVQEPLLGNAGETAAATAPEDVNPKAPAEVDEQPVHYGVVCDGCSMRYIRGTRYKSITKPDYDLCQACFEKPAVNRNEFIAFKRGRPPGVAMFARTGGRNGFRCMAGACPGMEKGTETEPTAAAAAAAAAEGDSEAIHYNVICDGCNSTPIVGPRFKSTKKEDYDLCQSCMQKIEGSTSDEYTRIDRPVAQFYPHMFLGRGFRAFPPYAMFPFMPFGRPSCARRIFVSGFGPEENEAAAEQQEVTKGVETEPKVPATPAAEKARSEEQTVAGTQEAVITKTEENLKDENVEGAQSPIELPVPEHEESQKAEDVAVPVQQQQQAQEDISSFEGMVAKLTAMGFTDSKLNEELLRKNNLDLRMTLDDLCAAEEWDPIMEELQEMGFYDTDMNRRLLFQNDGNMKSVLKQLVRIAKLGSGKEGEM